MNDLISRQAAIDAANRADYTGLAVEDVKKVTDEVVKELKRLPSAQSERKKGKWFNYQGNTKIVLCSECRMPALESMTGCLTNQHLAPNRTNFCPNCGADMKEEETDAEIH